MMLKMLYGVVKDRTWCPHELLASLWPKDKSNMLDIGSDGLRLTAVEYCTILEAS